MLVGGVVEDHVEHESDASFVCLADKLVKVVHCAEHGVDIAVIGHVVAAILERAHKERRDPQVVDAQIGQVVETLRDALEIAHAVAV